MRICALIPAYNEENTITEIIKTLARVELIDQIVVVDDGSEDDTTPVARAAGAEVIQMPENKGKGAAIMRGVESVEADVFLLLDGDLIGLNQEHVENLLAPVLEDGVDMAVGLFNEGRGLTDLAQYFAPNLSGQRAV
ncbi:MAG: glycosyltransferase, partial [Bacillota bacterium]